MDNEKLGTLGTIGVLVLIAAVAAGGFVIGQLTSGGQDVSELNRLNKQLTDRVGELTTEIGRANDLVSELRAAESKSHEYIGTQGLLIEAGAKRIAELKISGNTAIDRLKEAVGIIGELKTIYANLADQYSKFVGNSRQ